MGVSSRDFKASFTGEQEAVVIFIVSRILIVSWLSANSEDEQALFASELACFMNEATNPWHQVREPLSFGDTRKLTTFTDDSNALMG